MATNPMHQFNVYKIGPEIKINGIKIPKGISIIQPLGFYDFNALSKNAFCLMGDSGTTPEEGLYYKVPCVSIRKTSERYETIESGAHIVAGVESSNIINAVKTITSMPWGARYDFNNNGLSSPKLAIIFFPIRKDDDLPG